MLLTAMLSVAVGIDDGYAIVVKVNDGFDSIYSDNASLPPHVNALSPAHCTLHADDDSGE